ncbi:class F sortase, partial [Nocardioides sp.]
GPAAAAGAQAVPTRQASRAAVCRAVNRGFRPASVTIPGVITNARVLALGRDRYGTPRTPPLTARGRWQFAWDRASGIRPGERYGVVRLNAHTYPWSGAYGTALGNRLLRRLHTGDRIVVAGPQGQRLCYRVVKRVRVRPGGWLHGYYSNSGPSRLAILVCSGRRRGPGDWSHRTIWFAKPVVRS